VTTGRRSKSGSGLAALAELRAALRAAGAKTAHAAQRVNQQRLRDGAERDLFANAVGKVHRMAERPLPSAGQPKPEPRAHMRERDEKAAVHQSRSDEVTVESLLLTDDGLSFRRAGVGTDILGKLRRGHWALQGQIDLHGFTRDQARERLIEFVRHAHSRGLRCLRVVHGKGNGSPGRQPVLKTKVARWLAQCAEVMAFAQASAPQGGAGALLVLLAG
jgi:DNA-nicking Smr family endonuclease